MTEVHELKMHQRTAVRVEDADNTGGTVEYIVTRVPGGWIYEVRPGYGEGAAVFVPYSAM